MIRQAEIRIGYNRAGHSRCLQGGARFLRLSFEETEKTGTIEYITAFHFDKRQSGRGMAE